jgi:hypothetical protein
MEIDPKTADSELRSGKWDSFLDGDTKTQLFGEIRAAANAREAEAERRKKAFEKAREEKQRIVQNNFLEKMVNGTLSFEEILKSDLEPFGAGSKEAFIRMNKDAAEDKAKKSDPVTYQRLFDRIHLPDGHAKKLTNENELNAYMGRGLSLSDLRDLRAEIQGRGTEEGKVESDLKKGLMDVASSMLTKSDPMTGFKDAEGDEQLQKFRSWFFKEYAKKRQAGKTTQELLDPESPDYLGKEIRKYTKSAEQIMRETIRRSGFQTSNGPQYNVGDVVDGYVFKGGDQYSKENWEPVE